MSVEDCFSLVDNIAISDFHNNDINSDLVNLLNEKGSSIMPSGFFNKIMYMFMSYVMESLTQDIEFFTNNRNHEIKMTDGCPCCLSNV